MGSIAFVGMDVHKATIAVAVAEGVRGGEVLALTPERIDLSGLGSQHRLAAHQGRHGDGRNPP